MLLIAKVITISRVKFHCNRLTTVQDIQDYVTLIFDTQLGTNLIHGKKRDFTVESLKCAKFLGKFTEGV